MIYSNKKVVQVLGEILKSKSIYYIIISPGSRNSPIIIHFAKHKEFKTYSIVDERCAGFFALGIAQKIKKPVVINCTSGSSVVNYYPAIVEAYYQNIPIIVITADRPKELKTILEGQCIFQEKIFSKHVEMFAQLVEDESKKGIWYNSKMINESINRCILTKKPIHINIPFSNPLYKISNHISVKPKIIDVIPKKIFMKKIDYEKKIKIWKKYSKKMILIGMNYPNKKLKNLLESFKSDTSVVIFSDSTSHLYSKTFFSNIDALIFRMNYKMWIKLKPHILITIGIHIISNKIKNFLRKYPPICHWHIGEYNSKYYPDTYFSLDTYWPIDPVLFFQIIKKNIIHHNNAFNKSNYKNEWNKIKNNQKKKSIFFLKKKNKFSDLKALFTIFSKIPKNSILQLGNSMIIRYYQFLDIRNYSVQSYCNRGVSGIDGCISTAIGFSVVSAKVVTLVIGDISFFYDSNALWNNYIPNNFRIILINNGGGNIFHFISKNKISKKILNFFETKHNFSAKELCKMYNWTYEITCNQNNLENKLSYFWKKSKRPKLLEVNTKKCNNIKILKEFLL